MNTPTHGTALHGIVTMHLPSKLGYLRIARQSVIDFCSRAGMANEKCGQMEMAVDEACTNIIEHGGNHESLGGKELKGLRLSLIHQNDQIVIEIHDFGKAFDYNNHSVTPPEKYLEQGKKRGLGVYIIKSFIDDLTYSHDLEKGNCLRLIKKI